MQGRRPVLGVFAAALAVLVLVAGCGDDQAKRDNAYVDHVNTAQTDFARTINRLNGRVSATSTPSEDRATLAGYTEAIDHVVGELRGIDPPDSVKPLHRQLIAAMSVYGARVRTASKSVRSKSTSRLLDAQQKLLDATDTVSKQINTTIGAINKRLGS
jgi:outer membrane murein-binding lipoprotein Lpp